MDYYMQEPTCDEDIKIVKYANTPSHIHPVPLVVTGIAFLCIQRDLIRFWHRQTDVFPCNDRRQISYNL